MNWLSTALRAQIETAIDALEELSDIGVQRRRWSRNRGEMSSFTEAVESLFDDSGLGDEIEKGRSGLSAEAVTALAALSTALRTIDPKRMPDEVIRDPAMQKVRELAGTAMRLLRLESNVDSY